MQIPSGCCRNAYTFEDMSSQNSGSQLAASDEKGRRQEWEVYLDGQYLKPLERCRKGMDVRSCGSDFNDSASRQRRPVSPDQVLATKKWDASLKGQRQ